MAIKNFGSFADMKSLPLQTKKKKKIEIFTAEFVFHWD